jgi:hypothetical protein
MASVVENDVKHQRIKDKGFIQVEILVHKNSTHTTDAKSISPSIK